MANPNPLDRRKYFRPLALEQRSPTPPGDVVTNRAVGRNESGMGLPHSKTLSRRLARHSFCEVLECGCPLPLSTPFVCGLITLFSQFSPVRSISHCAVTSPLHH